MLPRIGEKFDGMGSFYKWTASAAWDTRLILAVQAIAQIPLRVWSQPALVSHDLQVLTAL